MSIKSELTKTASYLRNARNAIIGRGGEISPTAGLKDLSDAIYAIPSDAALVYQTDDSVAYRKIVPTGVLDFAKVSKVGGMSYKSKNLVDVGTVTFEHFKTFNVSSLEVGKTYYISTRITSNDTDSENNTIGFQYEDGTYFLLNYKRDKRFKNKFTPTKNVISINLYAGTNYPLSEGDTATYEDFMLCEEDTDVYEPYFAGLRHTKVTEMKSEGANLIPFPYRGTMGAGYTTTNNGITFTVLDDGRVMANGTATGNALFSIVRNFALPKGVFKISGGVTVDGVDSKAYVVVTAGLNGLRVAERTSIGAGKFDLTACEYDANDIYLLVANGTTLNNVIFEPMVTFYQEATLPYKPYKGSPLDTLTIPASVQSIDGYGVGVNADYNNYIEFVDGKALNHKVCETLVFDGVNEKINSVSSENGLYYAVKVLTKPSTNPYHLINSHFIAQTKMSAGYSYISGANKTHLIMFNSDQSLTTVDAWNAWLAAQYAAGNPVTAVYALAEPEVTDISTYLDDTIEVEGGGTLTSVNEHENAVPTTINYIAETAGA